MIVNRSSPQLSALPMIRTKLAPPRIESAPVSRQALLDRLEARRDRKLTLVLGPAGSGKTMLLAQWRKHLLLRGALVGWYNVGGDDDDAQFASYVVAALQQAGVPLGSAGLHAYLGTGGGAINALLGPIVDALDEVEQDVHLIIDDLHYAVGPGALMLIDRWLEFAPTRFHLTLGSRARPALSLARLQTADQLTELEFRDLRFDFAETRAFMAAQGLASLDHQQLSELQQNTDGWAAGLQLLAFALRHPRRRGSVALHPLAFHGQSRAALHEYLEHTTIHHLSGEELDFLTRISVCRRFNRDLCELLSGNARAGELLAKFQRANLFLLPIDTPDAEPWYRFHRLFSSFLNERLARRDPGEQRKLHQLASHWFAAKSLFAEALRHAHQADDLDLAVELLERSLDPLLRNSRFLEILKWCEALPRERIRSRPRICAARAWSELSCMRIEAFDESFHELEAIVRDLGDGELEPLVPDAAPDLCVEVELLRGAAAVAFDRPGSALSILEPMLARLPTAYARNDIAVALFACYALVYARRFEQVRAIARLRFRSTTPSPAEQALAPYLAAVEGLCYLVQGDIRQALPVLGAVLEDLQGEEPLAIESPAVAIGSLVEACYQANELDQARALLERYFEVTAAFGPVNNIIQAHQARARIELIDRHPAAARATLARFEEQGLRLRIPRIVAWALHDQVGMAVQAGEHLRVTGLLDRLDQLACEHPLASSPCAMDEITLAARLAHAECDFRQGDAPIALASIRSAAVTALEMGRRLPAVRLGLMEAIVRLRAGERAAALDAARQQVALARELGMMRLIPDLGVCIKSLVSALLRLPGLAPEDGEFLKLGVRALGPAPPEALAGEEMPSTAGPEALSPREAEILSLQAKGLSIKGIARTLGLSHYTVKWHAQNVYGKLGAASREDALAKARARRLLDS